MPATSNRDEPSLNTLQRGSTEPLYTAKGVAYPPKPFHVQIPILAGAFVGGPIIAGVIGGIVGNTSEGVQLFLYVYFTLVFFLGYAFWAARLASLVVTLFGARFLWKLLVLLFRRSKPRDLQELIPDRDTLAAFLVSSQRAAWAFFAVGVLLAAVCWPVMGLTSLFGNSILPSPFVLLFAIPWGYLLGWLGRHSYLPLPEPSE